MTKAAAALLLALATPVAAQTPAAAPPPPGAPSPLRETVASARHPWLRWPDFGDYGRHVAGFYEKVGYRTGWLAGASPTPQARAVITLLGKADEKGLDAEDYDGPRWAGWASRLGAPADRELFDAALTVSVMRYISDLRIGRINPKNLQMGLDVEAKKLHLPTFVEALQAAPDPAVPLAGVEPPFAGYRALRAQVSRYVALAKEPFAPIAAEKGLAPGKPFAGAEALAERLLKTGDLPAEARASLSIGLYGGGLAEAVKAFQRRHGLAPDGKLGPSTLEALNVPFADRLRQIRLTLERWRWLPPGLTDRTVLVNIPEFTLRALEPAPAGLDFVQKLEMEVVVGKAYRSETTVFEDEMRYLVFRPYWNVPASIARREVVPKARKDASYLARERYELVTPDGKETLEPTPDNLARAARGAVVLRQLPGPKNALGLVKFMFPNPFNIYLHDTPAQAGFRSARRDFSHGCVRVARPFDLAVWVLDGQPEWTPEKIRAAMDGDRQVQVNLKKTIPVYILYGTAIVDREGTLKFLDDIYGHDAALATALAEGYPYPI